MTDWSDQQVNFNFQLSDLTLFRLKLPMRVRSIKLDEIDARLENLAPPPAQLPRPSRGYLLRRVPIIGQLPIISRKDSYLCYAPYQYDHYFIDMNLSFDEYLQRFSSKTRSTINRKVKKYVKHCNGNFRWESYSRPEQICRFMALAREVSVLTYQEKLFAKGIPGSDAFLENTIALAQQDRVRAFILFNGERPVSYLYCPVEGDALIYAYMGYDPQYSKWSVGTVLQWLALEQLFNESKYRYFDFTEGQSEHKRLFATNHRRCANVYLLNNNVRNAILIRIHWMLDQCSQLLGQWAEKMGLKAKIKSLLRR